jgi:hypothetical protein
MIKNIKCIKCIKHSKYTYVYKLNYQGYTFQSSRGVGVEIVERDNCKK